MRPDPPRRKRATATVSPSGSSTPSFLLVGLVCGLGSAVRSAVEVGAFGAHEVANDLLDVARGESVQLTQDGLRAVLDKLVWQTDDLKPHIVQIVGVQ